MTSCGATRASSSKSFRAAPRRPPRSPPRRSPTCASAWASAPPVGRGRYREALMSLATLELDLELFTGPFDLLLALVPREGVALRALTLAELLRPYLDHPHTPAVPALEAA